MVVSAVGVTAWETAATSALAYRRNPRKIATLPDSWAALSRRLSGRSVKRQRDVDYGGASSRRGHARWSFWLRARERGQRGVGIDSRAVLEAAQRTCANKDANLRASLDRMLLPYDKWKIPVNI